MASRPVGQEGHCSLVDHKNAVIVHSGSCSCSCNNWKLITPASAPAETLTLLPESTPVCVHLWFQIRLCCFYDVAINL